ncbi:cytochrome P450 family protein [Actinomadura rugatobispora]|uniref:Cytochrome P450 n=1 Tax=Actinomadura rugatobispora TaxID=1994 RepID=A0ABW1AF80_9ACTN|nr:cytochrome P450 [Actinomadura rugatobispora]
MEPAHIVLDFRPEDVHSVNERLRRAGTLVPVEVEGVRVWAAARYATLEAVLTHPDLSRDIRHWSREGRRALDPGGSIAQIVGDTSLVNAEGAEHRRLRGPLARAFSPGRVRRLRPRIEALTAELVDRLALLPPGPVDLRREFAFPLPCDVIADLLGVPPGRRPELYEHGRVTSTTRDDRRRLAGARAGRRAVLAEIVAERRRGPGDDLISELVALEGDGLGPGEVLDTIEVLFVAGHVTTVNLITNAVRALLDSPSQLRLLRSGDLPWEAAVEESLRLHSPIGVFPMRYAVRDLRIDGVRVRKGEAVLACYAAAGRDPGRYGERAARFEPSGQATPHLSFGLGHHYCLGAPLARLQTEVALDALFEAFPDLAPAEPLDRLGGLNTVIAVSARTLPVLLGRRAR